MDSNVVDSDFDGLPRSDQKGVRAAFLSLFLHHTDPRAGILRDSFHDLLVGVGSLCLSGRAWLGCRDCGVCRSETEPGFEKLCSALPWPLLFCVLSFDRAAVYANEESVWRDTLEKNPQAWIAHFSLAKIVGMQGKFDEAISHYETALKIKPQYPEAHSNYGGLLAALGKKEEAISHYNEALRLKPDYVEAHNNLGAALADLGKYQEAIVHYDQALKLQPENAEVHFNLANALVGMKRNDQAVASYLEAIRIKPDYPEAENNLGVTLAAQGKVDDAILHFAAAVRLRPGYAEAMKNIEFLRREPTSSHEVPAPPADLMH